ncbi:unnamed protein product [Schistocephalus solidus]|uniref:Uncharacterized protein n=1 Tax=Schistocephalus solidus TaxID=70667 RepID=A0A183SWX9_SCHSO|nr:unnamed protein product [Schistocephalus solidus]
MDNIVSEGRTVAVRSHARRVGRGSWARPWAHVMAGGGADSPRPACTPAWTAKVVAPASRGLETNQHAPFHLLAAGDNDAPGSLNLKGGHARKIIPKRQLVATSCRAPNNLGLVGESLRHSTLEVASVTIHLHCLYSVECVICA